MEQENLIFLGARALFELGRYEEALDRLKPVSPRFGIGKANDDLFTKDGLAKACRAAIGKGR
jgi:hypothetical protein